MHADAFSAPTPPNAGQRHHLTVLFSDLSASSALGEAMEAEDYAAMLDAVRGVARALITRHGGHIARIQGDGLLALFGFPEAREDDARRAAYAALAIHAAVSQLEVEGLPDSNAPLHMHSGVHSGLTYVSHGDLERGRFEVLGEVPNTAARLSDLAERDQILVSEDSLGPQLHNFETTPARWMTLAGRSAPLRVLQVLRIGSAERRLDASLARGVSPLVGREQATQALLEALAVARQGVNTTVAVIGAAGLGKTRLLEAVCSNPHWRECLTLRGYCESYLGAEPLQPFMQVLRAACGFGPSSIGLPAAPDHRAAHARLGALAPTLDAQTALHLLAVAGGAEPPVRPGGIAPAIVALLDALACAQPLVLMLDDWQWADNASRQLLDSVRAMARPLLVVLASRPDGDEAPPAHARVVTLEPLGLHDARQAILARLPAADPFLIQEIHGYAGGIPLYVEELCHATAGQLSLHVPDKNITGTAWLNAMVEARLDRLPDEAARAVRVAAVIGNVIPAWLLEQVSGHQARHPVWRLLARRDLLFHDEQPGMVRFKHGLTRDAVYDTVGLHTRRALHLQVAQALARGAGSEEGRRGDALEALAYHYGVAGQHDEATRFAELAGDKAMAAFALDRARLQYMAALRSLDQQGTQEPAQQLHWCALANKLGMACVFDPLALRDGLAVFERAVVMAHASAVPVAMARSEYWLGYISYAKGRPRSAEGHCRVSLARAEALGDARLVAQVKATLGQVLVSACDYRAALPLIDGAIDIKRQQSRPGSGVAIGSAYALSCKGCVLGDQGHFEQAHACFAEALQLLGDSAHAVGSSVRGWAAAVLLWQGRWDEADQMAAEGARIAEGARTRQLLAMSGALGGYARWRRDGDAQALQALRDTTGWIEQRDGAFFTSLNYGWLVDACIAQGAIGEARRHGARLLLRARQHDRLGEAMGCRALAVAANDAGEPARARHWLARAQSSAAARGSQHEAANNRVCEARIENTVGHAGQALALLDQAGAAFEALAMPWHAALARHQAEQIRSSV